MGNGTNEPIQFTRGDAERIANTEIRHNELHDKVDLMTEILNAFLETHRIEHTELNAKVHRNSRFRRGIIKVALWTLTPTGTLAIVARAFGWF
jgi:hypothetical protein